MAGWRDNVYPRSLRPTRFDVFDANQREENSGCATISVPFYPRIIKPDLIGSRRKFRSKSSIFQFPDSLDTGNFEQIDRLPPPWFILLLLIFLPRNFDGIETFCRDCINLVEEGISVEFIKGGGEGVRRRKTKFNFRARIKRKRTLKQEVALFDAPLFENHGWAAFRADRPSWWTSFIPMFFHRPTILPAPITIGQGNFHFWNQAKG